MGTADRVLAYIKEQYGIEPEFLWAKFPDNAAFRHKDNRKWFAAMLWNTPNYRLAKMLNVHPSTVASWRSGITEPKYETIIRIEDIFKIAILPPRSHQVPLDTPDEDNPQNQNKGTPVPHPINDDDIKFALFGGRGDITDEMYEEVKSFAAFVRQREEAKKKMPQD